MPQQRVGEGRTIEVFGEELFGGDRLSDLHQRTIRAEDKIQRVGLLRLAQLFGREQSVGERSRPQRKHRLQVRAVAGATGAYYVIHWLVALVVLASEACHPKD